MPSRFCDVCKKVVPSSEFGSHRQAHVDSRKERKGGGRPWRRIRTMIIARDMGRCVVCRSTRRLEVHHIDGNWRNNDPDNLETRCFDHNPRGRGTH